MEHHPNPYYTPQTNNYEQPLPPGWEMLIDKSSGMQFFVNHNTQKTQWHRPVVSNMTGQAPPTYNHLYNPPQQGRVREIPVIRETRSDSPRRSQTPTRTEQPPHQGSPSQKVYNIPVQYVDKPDTESFTHGSPLRHFEGRNSPRSGSPWRQDRAQTADVTDGTSGPYGWTSWVGGSPNRPQGMPHHPAPQTPPFPVDTPPQTYTYSSGNTNTSPYATDNSRIHYPHGSVQPPHSQPDSRIHYPAHGSVQPPHSQPDSRIHYPEQTNQPADYKQPREIPITKIPPQEPPSTNGPTVQYTTEETTPENVNLGHEEQPRATHRATESLKAEERQATRSPSPSPAHLTPLEQVELVATEINSLLQEKVSNFNGKMKDKDYKYIEEMLTRCMLKLDRIESHGKDEVRLARKAAIRATQSGLDQLELKAFSNDTVTGGDDAHEQVVDKDIQQETSKSEQQQQQEIKRETPTYGQQRGTKDENNKPNAGHVTDMVLDNAINC